MVGSLLLNYYFTPPMHTLTIAEANNVLALGVFVAVALIVSSVVDLAARRTRQAARASAEAELLTTMAGSVLRGQQALPAVLDRVREAFGMDSVTLAGARVQDGSTPVARRPVARCGLASRSPAPEDADVEVPVGDRLALAPRAGAARRRPPGARRLRRPRRGGAGAAAAAASAGGAPPIAEADRIRTALLAAVSHDLRTPLASAKAAVTSLRSTDVQWTAEDRDELLATADESPTGSTTWWTTCST